MPQEIPQVQTLMQSLISKVEEREQKPWFTCPSCQVEWNRLRPCNFIDDENRPSVQSLCVKCAETLIAWDWLVHTMPLPMAFVTYTKWVGPRSKRVGMREDDVIDIPTNAVVIAEVSGMEIAAKSEGTGRPIRYKIKGQDQVYTADNVYQLRSKFVHTIPY